MWHWFFDQIEEEEKSQFGVQTMLLAACVSSMNPVLDSYLRFKYESSFRFIYPMSQKKRAPKNINKYGGIYKYGF